MNMELGAHVTGALPNGKNYHRRTEMEDGGGLVRPDGEKGVKII